MKRLLFVAIMFFTFGASVHASIVTFQMSGITISENPSLPSIPTNTNFSIIYSFESTSPDTRPDDTQRGLYYALTSGQFSILGNSYVLDPSSARIWVVNNFQQTQDIDEYSPQLYCFSGPAIDGLSPISINADITLIDSSGTVFDSIDLPLSPPDLDAFDTNYVFLNFFPGTYLDGRVTSLKIVPIPGAIWLLSSGLVGLAVVRRMFRRK